MISDYRFNLILSGSEGFFPYEDYGSGNLRATHYFIN